ncbi:SDR family oxidoreductase [Oceanidesulfovibrio marinus]|uniref:SDR family oxidoreductase n=1 Tax=Oceanidesulfovibrio marinus TaxID=370038 RepID=A0ABX6NAR6_9BACT|nr:SDR family oxidoreductase [Oceanidesulfovibrio marinus]QJT07684.1 SDR family oxidoreductase [Oceanidesulfovibrio marinus]
MNSTRTPSFSAYDALTQRLQSEPRTWCVTGVAGFIGSNLLETLLALGQNVVGIDNFATGHQRNLDEVHAIVGEERFARFTFYEADITDYESCRKVCANVDFVLHQAALGSVPRSLDNPLNTNSANITGFLNMLEAARREGCKRFVYACSSSTYGDSPTLPKVEDQIGEPLSPYAVTKYVDELYGRVFTRCYGMSTLGLRYFNVFGPRQDPEGAYAAVIPKWFDALMKGEPAYINGDGETSRDFSFVANVVRANLLAATTPDTDETTVSGSIMNIACGERTTLNELFALVREQVATIRPEAADQDAVHRDFRPGDVRHSLADITKIRSMLAYEAVEKLREGLTLATPWYAEFLG